MIALERGIASPHYLFYGPTGTGKTSFARKLAKTTDSYYYFIKGSALVEKNGPSQFRKLMRRVRSVGNRPIIFIDEADKVISDSSKLRGRAHDVFNEILTETGDTNNRTCTFIFTTNKLHLIDMRIKNSKRVQKVYFGLPDISMRIKMIKNNLKYYFTDPEALGDLDAFEYDQMTPEVIKLAAEATKTWDPRSYDYFFESLRRTLIDKDVFICTPKDFFDHITFIETEEKKAQAHELALKNQYEQK